MKNQRIKTGKLQMKALLLAGVLVFESVFAGIGPVNAQTVSGNKVTAEESMSLDVAVSENTAMQEVEAETKMSELQEEQITAEKAAIKYSGTDGAVNWSIDENGHLKLTGDGDYDGISGTYNDDPEWLLYKSEIISAEVSVTNMTTTRRMFNGCSIMIDLNLDDFDTSKVTDMSYMFSGCSGLKTLTFGKNFNTSNVTNMFVMFAECSGLKSIDLSNFDTSKVTDMGAMFALCSGLTSLDLSSFDTSNVETMVHFYGMFSGCSSLESLKFGPKFNVTKVKSLIDMFGACQRLKSLDLSSFDTTNVETMAAMFEKCSSLESVKFGSDFDTSNVETMAFMFRECSSLKSLDISCFDTSGVKDMSCMFDGCSGLETLTLGPAFDTSNVTDMSSMFSECSSLSSLDLSSWDLRSLQDSFMMLTGMDRLVRITLPNIPIAIDFSAAYYNDKKVLTYFAGANLGKVTYTLQKYADSYCGMNGHTYSSPVFTWAEDYSSAKVNTDCIREDCVYNIDGKHVQMDAAITKETIQPTTEKEGATIYTATVVFKGKTYTDVKSIAIPKLPVQTPTAKPVGTSFKTSTTFYRVTKSGKTPEIAYMGPRNKKVKKVTIPATVKIDGVTYKVTSVATGALKNYKKLTTVTVGKNVTKIGKNAFYGCKKLKKIVIKSKKLKSIGKNAFKGIKKNATIDVPNSKKKAYKKLLKAKTGFKKKTMKIK